MRHLLTPLLTLIAVASAFYLHLSSPRQDGRWQLKYSLSQAADRDPASRSQISLQIFNRAIIYIKENYVDPKRIDPRRMFRACLEELQKNVPELLARFDDRDQNQPSVTLQIGQQTQTLSLKELDNSWQIALKLKDVFRFILNELQDKASAKDLEYTAIEGLLETLDPHSILMRPKDYRLFKIGMFGKYAGVGFLASYRKDQLTITHIFEGSPADRKGLKIGDRVVQIGLDSTLNMTIEEAISAMSGEPGSQVDIWIQRDGWKKPRKYVLTREDIKLKSVQAELLPHQIAWIQLHRFQNSAAEELKTALTALNKQSKGLRGVILDLRDNPGGLLDQAIKIVDFFIETGTIVTTVGYGEKIRAPQIATHAGTFPRFPMVILINQESASASEAVAGALKNHHRALVLGQTSFGKGSVQVVYDNPDDSALKLTIAQYLTPGDLSIQSVGIIPHVQLVKVNLEKENLDLFRTVELNAGHHSESELPFHLNHESAQIAQSEKPLFSLKYLEPKASASKSSPVQKALSDFEVRIAQEILAQTENAEQESLIESTRQVIAHHQEEQNQAIFQALLAQGIDWSENCGRGHPRAEIKITSDPAPLEVKSGQNVTLRVEVFNQGDGPFCQLRAFTKSDNPVFDGHELLFGMILPKKSVTYEVSIPVPDTTVAREDRVSLQFSEAKNANLPESAVQLRINPQKAPQFALRWQLDDREKGNGDGVLQPEEEALLRVSVRNLGPGFAESVLGILKLADSTLEEHTPPSMQRNVLLQHGRFKGKSLQPDEETELLFSFKVKKDLQADRIDFALHLQEPELKTQRFEQIALPIAQSPLAIQNQILKSALNTNILVDSGCNSGSPLFVASTLQSDGQTKDCYRIPLPNGLYGWVSKENVIAVPGELSNEMTLQKAEWQAPPQIVIAPESEITSTSNEFFDLRGEVINANEIRGLSIYLATTKLDFIPPIPQKDRLPFQKEIALAPGQNRITLIAHFDNRPTLRQTLFVRRSLASEAKIHH